jgi:hypothetical protein
LGNTQICGGVKLVNGIPTLPCDNWISNGNAYKLTIKKKPAQKDHMISQM